jgi:hypothetical protein
MCRNSPRDLEEGLAEAEREVKERSTSAHFLRSSSAADA